MKAMVLNNISQLSTNRTPLSLADMPVPIEEDNGLLIKVSTCGVCHTELDEIEGRTPPTLFPIVLGHQIVGRVVRTGSKVSKFTTGDRVGVAWIHSACGKCKYCEEGNDNLCDQFKATGRDVHGGYGEYTTVTEDFAFRIPEIFSDEEAAPLLCAGTIGYRSLRLTGLKNGENLGLTGFGASAHLVIQMAQHKFPRSRCFVFARSAAERAFAIELGAFWSGDTDDDPPEKLHSIIDTTPVWRPVVQALKNLEKGGRLVINAIRKEEVDKESLLAIDYPSHIWLEKEIKSVANVSKQDVREFLQLAAEIPIRPEVQIFSLEDANRALIELKEGKIRGAKVLRII
ncbi:MAG: alcohol dehydrogenase [Syntrophus sp. (in: bacteria)]|nr:alcohol dehydrogenase [Syntrophus sp. (in: bacteria)]